MTLTAFSVGGVSVVVRRAICCRGAEDTHQPSCSHTYHQYVAKAYYQQLPGAGGCNQPVANEDQVTERVVCLVTTGRKIQVQVELYEVFYKSVNFKCQDAMFLGLF